MTRWITQKKQGFYWEDPSDAENAITVFLNQGGGLSIAVSEERAMDSYNQTFECSAFLARADAERLRDYLTEVLAAKPHSPA